IAPLPHRNLRHPWLRYQVDGYDEGILGEVKRRITWRQFILALVLHSEEEMAKLGFGAYWAGSERVIPDKGDLRDYWIEISSDIDFLGPTPSYVHIRDPAWVASGPKRQQTIAAGALVAAEGAPAADSAPVVDEGAQAIPASVQAPQPSPTEEMTELGFRAYWPAPSYFHIRDPVRRLCHRRIACSISGRGQGAEKVTVVDLFYLRTMDRRIANVPHLLAQYFFHHAKGRNSRAQLSGGHFIGRLAAHFGLISDEGLRGLSVVVSKLPVAPGPERQQTAAAGVPTDAEGAPAADEGAQVVPPPMQAPQTPPPAPQP
ncbi:hypothetical protein Tco_1277737, partial [Tanacetum coccineum]